MTFFSAIFRENFSYFFEDFLLNNIFLSEAYFNYFSLSETYGYTIDLVSTQFILSVTLPVVIILISRIFCWERINNVIKDLILFISFVPIIAIVFSTSAIFAYRLSGPFKEGMAPLVGYLWLRNNYSSKSQLLFARFTIVVLSLLLLSYNLFIKKNLATYQI